MASRNTYYQDEVIERRLDVKQFAHILRYIVPHRAVFGFVLLLMAVSSVTTMCTPLLLRRIVDVAVPSSDQKELIYCISGMIALAVVEIVITFIHQRWMGIMGHEIIATIRKDAFEKLQQLPFDYFDSRPNGKIVVRVTDYVNELANFFTNYVLMLVVYTIKLVVAFMFMLSLSGTLTMVVLAAVIPMIICIGIIRDRLRRLFGAHRAKISNRVAFLVEAITGERIIKSYNRASASEDIYRKVHQESVDQWLKIYYTRELNSPATFGFWNLGVLMLYGVSMAMILKGGEAVTAGVVIAFINYMSQFSQPLTELAQIIQQLAQVSSNLEQVFDLINHPVEIANDSESVELHDVKGRVDFNDVTFAYDEGHNVLEHFDLHVEPGQTIALVGPTGAGKTTVINLLTRFYDVCEGSVTVDGVDVRKADLTSLRREVGVLMQDPFIFKGTILENIRYGRPSATDRECMEAAALIHADEFIKKLPDGYEHVVEERGAGLSAGEKQLISFARIILKNPSIIILDEATSAIDTETEMLIQDALTVVLRDKTAFMVAHRLSTIRGADRILYIANRGIQEQGSHEELMARRGLYYSLNQGVE